MVKYLLVLLTHLNIIVYNNISFYGKYLEVALLDNVKRVMISLPHTLLQEVDGFVQKSSGNRSEFIREAMKLYLQEKKKQEIRESLRNGYIEMSEINRELADEGISFDAKIMLYYEESLAECE